MNIFRLTRDIEDLREIAGVIVTRGERPNMAIVEFDPSSVVHRGDSIPSRFLVTVPRYYPHNPPQIRCLDGKCYGSLHIDLEGNVKHPELESNWSPIKSLYNVVQTLHDIRMLQASFPQHSNLHGDQMMCSPNRMSILMSPGSHIQSSTIDPPTPRGVEGVQLSLAFSENDDHQGNYQHQLSHYQQYQQQHQVSTNQSTSMAMDEN